METASPLSRKLGIRLEARLVLVGAPGDLDLGPLPPGVSVRRRLSGRADNDVILAFFRRRAELERRLPRLKASLDYAGGLWLAWPKRSADIATDLGDGPVRELGLAAGLIDNKVCALDATWSALRFVYRVADRPPATT
ncbi:MAG TPA: DUF3052 domain-containing protein [Solirubrobacteraceae bacterium]